MNKLETMDHMEMWQAVLSRDAGQDGRFVYAVRSTGVYCRPSCPSRRPKPENVRFFQTPAQAAEAGFRPCKRCRPDGDAVVSVAYDLARQLARRLDAQPDDSHSLEALSAEFHLSPFHLQRTFRRIMGVSPKQYALARRAERLKTGLRESSSVTRAAYDAGFGNASAVYDRHASRIGVAPGHFKRGAPGARVAYALARCDLGWLLVGATGRGVCAVRLGDDGEALAGELQREYPAAEVVRDDAGLGGVLADVLGFLADSGHTLLNLPLDVRGTAFQMQVWQALRAIPAGSTRSYGQVAEAIGKPRAVRAVAQACAANPAALVIPCHRVVRADGALSGYRWGPGRKAQLLAHERAAAA